MESTESTRKKRDKMKQIDQTQGDEQLVNQNQQISNTTTGAKIYRKLLQTPLGFENSMILTTSRFTPEPTNEQMQSTETYHQKVSTTESYYKEFDEIYNNTFVEPLTENEKEKTMEELYKSNNKLFRLEVNPRYTAGDNLGESSIDEQQQWLNLYSNNSHTQISNDGILTNDAVLDKSMDSTTAQEGRQETNENNTQMNDASEATNAEYLDEEDIDNFLKNEEEGHKEVDSRCIPHINMQFDSSDQAYDFFNFYAYQAGFSVVKTHNYKSTSKKRQDGKKKKKSNTKQRRKTKVIIRTDCKCVMVVREERKVWKIIRLELNHNHELSPNTEKKFLRSHKNMTEEEKKMIKTLKECNIPIRNMIAILSFLRGGLAALPYTKKDVSNVCTAINSETRNADMKQVLSYLRNKEQEDPDFYYKFQLDEENKVKNMFWADGRSIELYAEYGDIISFDTTYQTNKYNLPFAPFVGITGHGNTCLFGCAFLGDETTETFKWVFETFLTAMSEKHPQTIITDQDNAMRSAIRQVFKQTKHRNCLFHVKKNCREKTGSTFSDKTKKDLHKDFEDIVNNCLTREEFESLWPQMIEKYSLHNVKYFEHMWKTREQFVPVYFKTDFCPFIQSTALSEGTNARFKRSVGPKHSVMSFMNEYESINDTIFSTEYIKDHESRTKRPDILWCRNYIEEQALQLYNLSIFEKFQEELIESTRMEMNTIKKGKIYEVFIALNQTKKEWRPRKYVVITDLPQENYSCICGKFSKDGILCCHILKVMLALEIKKIPEKYIIERWRKKERKHTSTSDRPIYNGNSSMLRFNVLSRKSVNIASKASKRKETYECMLNEIENLDRKINAMLEDVPESSSHHQSNTVNNVPADETEEEITVEQEEIADPDIANTKGRKSVRQRRIVEKIIEKTKNHCSRCGKTNHTIENCPLMQSKSRKLLQQKTAGATGQNQAKQQEKKKADINKEPESTKRIIQASQDPRKRQKTYQSEI
uniref:OSIGBa0145N07.10 protein n=1 Tax=Oryza sativa TaxID=4530 RepID=Q01LB7_ORYSA|nr:OSIGBa0145N07.10 [Oryza sativa]